MVPVMISSSHRRPRAIAVISRRRRSARSGRISSRTAPCGIRIFRNRFDGGFCQGIDNVTNSADRSVGFSEMTSWVLCTSMRDECGKHIMVEFNWIVVIGSLKSLFSDTFLKRRDDRLLDLGTGD